jgi:hypothetical protein
MRRRGVAPRVPSISERRVEVTAPALIRASPALVDLRAASLDPTKLAATTLAMKAVVTAIVPNGNRTKEEWKDTDTTITTTITTISRWYSPTSDFDITKHTLYRSQKIIFII